MSVATKHAPRGGEHNGLPAPDDAWDDDDPPATNKHKREAGDLDEWAFDEQEAQDWIDAEQEVQRMLVFDDDIGEGGGEGLGRW